VFFCFVFCHVTENEENLLRIYLKIKIGVSGKACDGEKVAYVCRFKGRGPYGSTKSWLTMHRRIKILR
jgi:hypothetical protein